MMDLTQAALVAWQILHTILTVVVIIYLLTVNQRLRELRSVRAEVQAWLTEFNKLITSGTLAARELKQSLAVAQLKMPSIVAARESQAAAAPAPPPAAAPTAPKPTREEVLRVTPEELAALAAGNAPRPQRAEARPEPAAKPAPPNDPLAKLF